jgi:hypothetical protein
MSTTQQQTKPSKELLTSAILSATTRIKADEAVNCKELRSALERVHPEWKLSDRRVTKHVKRIKKLQSKGSKRGADSYDIEDDADSVASSCMQSEGSSAVESSASSASSKAKMVLKLNKSLRKTLTLKSTGGSSSNKASSKFQVATLAFEAPPQEAKKSNILPQLEDDFLSDNENDNAFSSANTSPTASSPRSVSFDQEEDVQEDLALTLSVEETPEEMLRTLSSEIDDKAREESGILIGEKLLSEAELELDPIDVAAKESTKQEREELYADENDGNKEGAVCEGCVIL